MTLKPVRTLSLFVAMMYATALPAVAAETTADSLYSPPTRGAPKARVGGASRGQNSQGLVLSAVSPDHLGLTAAAAPALYWFASGDLDAITEITIVDKVSLETVLETSLPAPVRKGFHSIELGQHNVQLALEREYQWFVAAIANPAQRSSDIVAGGEIMRIELDDVLQSRLRSIGASERPLLQAGSGLWYDAVHTLSQLIAASPGRAEFWRWQVSLLRQVGLEDAADHAEALSPR